MSTIDATSISLLDFFTKEDDPNLEKFVSSKILVPSFQRNYSWDKKHVKDFIDSINGSDKGYYIGNIIVQSSRGSSSRDLVVDGQQRLTSIFLILKALDQIGLKKTKKNIFNKIVFKNNDIPRIEFIRKNLNSSFISIIKDNDLSDENFPDENSKKFLSNYNYIKKQLLLMDDLDLFFEKIIKVIFVVIRFDDGFDINQLFEGLNSKGKILSPVQLTKNALIGTAKETENEKKIVSLWEDVEKEFEKSKKIVWFDKFLRHRGFYNYNYISNANLFKKIKDDIKKEDDVLKFSLNLKEDAFLYSKLRKGEILKSDISNNFSEGDWNMMISIIRHASTMDIDQIYGALFACLKYAKNNKEYIKGKNSNLLKDIKSIWFFSILAKFSDLKPSLFERDFAVFSHNLFLGKYKESRKLFEKLRKIIKDIGSEKFADNLNQRIKITGNTDKSLTYKNNRNFITPILLLYLTDGNNFIITGYTIEHIIPKGSLDKWSIDELYINEIKNNIRYRIGNLTLLEKDDLGNDNFDLKLKSYKKDYFEKNKKLIEYKKEFNSTNPSGAVKNRGSEICNSLFEILKNNI